MKAATVKRSIVPVTFTVTVKASRINENGVFSGLTVEAVTGPNGTAKVAVPPSMGGAMFLKVEDLKGLTFLSEGEVTAAKAEKKKLF